MRALLYPPILLGLTGCLTEAAFNEKYAAKKCEEFQRCVTSDDPCAQLGTTTTTADPAVCEFDRAAARECLRGVWSCDERFEGYEFPIPPAACASVCGSVTPTGTGTGTGTGDAM